MTDHKVDNILDIRMKRQERILECMYENGDWGHLPPNQVLNLNIEAIERICQLHQSQNTMNQQQW